MAGDGIYGVGVDTEAAEALEAADMAGMAHAPYVDRDVDEPLRNRLVDSSRERRCSLIVLLGPSKAGKSRTNLEALRSVAEPLGGTLADAMLIEPADASALATMASDPPPPELRAVVPSVVWLDDIEPFVITGKGLNTRTLPDWFNKWARPVLILGTAGGKGGEAAREGDYADPLDDLLRAYPPLQLTPWLTDGERHALAANPAYSTAAAERIGQEGVGEFMVVASRIRKRLSDQSDCPEGLAVAQAAIDWQRLGLLRPVPEAALRKLYRAYLPGPDLPGRFQTGITWATEVLYSSIRLVHGADPYQPYDYAVRYERERGRRVEAATWDALIEHHATPKELSSVGVNAIEAGLPDRAEAAFRRADERDDATGAYNLGVLLEQRGEMEDAEDAYRRADERGDAAGAHNHGVLLHKRGEREDAEAAFRRADERGDAAGAYNLGVMLHARGYLQDAEDAYRRADERGDAEGALSLGRLLRQRGDLEGAETAETRAIERAQALERAFRAQRYPDR